jgi:hypothetical protein
MSDILQCGHMPKISRNQYRCSSTGDYEIELCLDCSGTESKQFLIKEVFLQ